ncbi:MAG: aspartate/glutamate racemase family protein [Desulfobacula sp.]|nr:aspartate/glutamate racemase family protein [Desulfobacula sp.]
MSVFARIASYLVKDSPWQNVSMIYFNAWPEQDRGYNHFDNMDQKAKVFNNALNAMENFEPDMILIACNTLSVIYPFTSYSKTTRTKVAEIVDHGVQLIHEKLDTDPDSHLIIFGTPTTITEKTHQLQLIKRGIDPGRITSQGCINLAGKIERNPFSSDVSKMITANVEKAVAKMQKSTEKVYAALCCTHFGYCKDLFQKALSEHVNGDIIILNPNERMADQVMMENTGKINTFSPDIDMQIVSRVFWEPERIDAYVRLLKEVSLKATETLKNYEWNPNLFKV